MSQLEVSNKPCPTEIILFRTADGITHIGEYKATNNKWVCEIFIENYYDHDVVEWWSLPTSATGNRNR